MLIQEGLSKLKLLKSKIERAVAELQSFSASNSKLRHQWGVIGQNQEYNIKHAEDKVRSTYQAFGDLVKDLTSLKLALDYTNSVTEITFDNGTKMTVAAAIFHKREVAKYKKNLITAVETSIARAKTDVDMWNTRNSAATDKADIQYLFPQTSLDTEKLWLDEFLEQVDAKLQISNANTQIIGYPVV